MADERAVAQRRRRRSFGERVRAAREKAGLSQGDAAKKARMFQSSWCRLETGGRPDPRGETIRRIARALGVEPSELLD